MPPKEIDEEFLSDLKTIDYLVGVIKNIHKEKGLMRGKMRCPKCGDDLFWAIAKYNRHTRGSCRKDNCLTWIE